ncbi:MaoC family dehydratase [Afifella sp. IM 167]|uniref:MaoC family dehydratase n=1 Tax=Afifella sp. IM 167 TaxID=2033586 RepID=UPI001CD02680|nr:MaoC family dehydratase [Afifella sp. IM 167]MBZ8134875.1 dehydratase [Afifella sp. IM 167]
MKAFEDIAIGDRSELGSHRFSAEEIIRFAKAFDPQPFHTSEAGGSASPFGRMIASGWHTAAAFMKLYVAFDKEHQRLAEAEGGRADHAGPSPGFEDMRWRKPVHAGDTLTYVSEVREKRDLRSMPGWGLVILHNEAHNQDGELVYSFTGKVFVRRRAPEAG